MSVGLIGKLILAATSTLNTHTIYSDKNKKENEKNTVIITPIKIVSAF